jgi:predicted metalloprotease with PDZ domain
MDYTFKYLKGQGRTVPIEVKVNGPFSDDGFEIALPAWRPGRYELGYFARNIRGFRVTDEDGAALLFEKVSHSRWKVKGAARSIMISYDFHAGELNGGSCWWDHDQLYINPIQCAVRVIGKEHETCNVFLEIPDHWKVATGMERIQNDVFQVKDYDELVDSPFIASANIRHGDFRMDEIDFHIWIQGDCEPDMDRIIADIKNYTRVQFDTMGSFPVNAFHYLIQIKPEKFYHGVEHLTSTVLVLGPGSDLMTDAMYENLIGVASHELFHVWNVKSIRPVEMMPYDYDRENYSSLGLVYEGVTTYYGDLFLARSGFFDLENYLKQVNTRLQLHMNNPGRFNYSVLESSVDTWLDGYTPGIPGRKTSIYHEGCLLALCTDLLIRKHSDSQRSLDDVMKALYHDFALKGAGYTYSDYLSLVIDNGVKEISDFFDQVVTRAVSYQERMNELLGLAGLKINNYSSDNLLERYFGLKTTLNENKLIVNNVLPCSPASENDVLQGDELLSVGGENNVTEIDLTTLKIDRHLELKMLTGGVEREVKLTPSKEYTFYDSYRIEPVTDPTPEQLDFRRAWLQL